MPRRGAFSLDNEEEIDPSPPDLSGINSVPGIIYQVLVCSWLIRENSNQKENRTKESEGVLQNSLTHDVLRAILCTQKRDIIVKIITYYYSIIYDIGAEQARNVILWPLGLPCAPLAHMTLGSAPVKTDLGPHKIIRSRIYSFSESQKVTHNIKMINIY